jgi:hypothetical protein
MGKTKEGNRLRPGLEQYSDLKKPFLDRVLRAAAGR